MLVEKYKLESMEKAEVVLELMEELDEGEGGEGYPLYYYVNAARDHSSLEEAQKYFIQPCPICFGCYPVHEVSSSLHFAFICVYTHTHTHTHMHACMDTHADDHHARLY